MVSLEKTHRSEKQSIAGVDNSFAPASVASLCVRYPVRYDVPRKDFVSIFCLTYS